MSDHCPACGYQLTPSNKSRATRLPKDWTIPEKWIIWAMVTRPSLNAREQAEMFKDYWTAKSGKDASKLDWEATWRNWIRGAKSNTNGGPAALQPKRPSSPSSAPLRRLSDAERSKSLGTNLPKILEQIGLLSTKPESKS